MGGTCRSGQDDPQPQGKAYGEAQDIQQDEETTINQGNSINLEYQIKGQTLQFWKKNSSFFGNARIVNFLPSDIKHL